MTIVTAVVTSTVLLVVGLVVVVLVVVMVTVLCRRHGKEGVYKDTGTNRGVRFQVTQKFPMNVDPAHFHHQSQPLHNLYTNTTSVLSITDNGDHISLQDCPAYKSIEDTPTWGLYTYIDIGECRS